MHFHIVYCIDAHMKMDMLHEDPHDESMQLINKWPWWIITLASNFLAMPLLRLPFYCLCMKIIQSSVPFISSEAMKHQWKKTKKSNSFITTRWCRQNIKRHSKRLLNIISPSAWFIILVYSQPYCIVLGKLVATSYKSGHNIFHILFKTIRIQ